MAHVESDVLAREAVSEAGGTAVRVIDGITRPLRRVIQAAAYVAGFLVLAMTLFMTFDVLMRYGFGRATAIADDVTAYMLVGMTFLAAGSTQLARQHISVETFVVLVPPRARRVLEVVTLAVALGYVVFMIWHAFPYVAASKRLMYLSSGLVRFPLWMPQTFIPVGLTVLALALAVQILDRGLHLRGQRPMRAEAG